MRADASSAVRAPRTSRRLADGPTVILEPGEPLEAALRRFKRQVEAAHLDRELRRRAAYEPPAARRRRKHRRAVKRLAKVRAREAPRG